MNHVRIDGPSAARGFTALVLVLVVAWTSCSSLWPDSNADAEAAPDASSDRVVGRVKAFDSHARVLLLITGVGHALRVVRVTVPPGVGIQGAGPYPPELEPGCIVRVEFAGAGAARAATAARAASSITVLRLPSRGRTP